MKFLCILSFISLLCSCRQKAPQPADPDKRVLDKGADSLVPLSTKVQNPEMLSDSVYFFRHSLKDTIREDVNCDGFTDRIYLVSAEQSKHIILIDGKNNQRSTFGIDQPVKGEWDADYSWVDFWGITKDKVTWEMHFEDDEISGSGEVVLECPSLVLRKEEEGGGIITFKHGSYVWVHQAD
jgi:hypothetical protein